MSAESTAGGTPVQDLVELVRQQALALEEQAALLERQTDRLNQLEAEAARVKQLEAQVDGLRAAAALVEPVAPLGTDTGASTVREDARGADETVSRRTVLRTAGLVGLGSTAAAAGAVASAAPAAATQGTMIFGAVNDAGADTTGLDSSNIGRTLSVRNLGVGSAITAASSFSSQRPAIEAVIGSVAPAIHGRGGAGSAIVGETSSTFFGVHGIVSGAGSAVYGQNLNAASTAGVFGEGPGVTRGVWGRNTGTDANGIGVFGESAAGRGASFGGPVAAVRLRPSSAANRPDRGQRGDFVVDSTGRLWFCKGGATWRQLA